MARAGFRPQEAIELWKNMARAGGGSQPPEFLSTHPGPDRRIERLNSHMAKAMEYYNAAK
jgi:predicted Zn-dependent protease